MRRLALLLTLFCALGSLSAQKDTSHRALFLGGGGGVTYNNVDFRPITEQSYMIGALGGVAVKYISEKHLGLIAELNFVQKGWRESFDPETQPDFAYKRTLNYLEIPFLTHVYFGNKVRFIFNAGPKISFLLGENHTMSTALADNIAAQHANDPEAPIGVQYGPIDTMNRVDYGLLGGLGVALKTGVGDMDLEGRYYFGLADLFTSRRSENAYFSRSAHRIIEAKLTWYFKVL